MSNSFLKTVAAIMMLSLLSGCARDLSSDMYVSSATLSLTMEGSIISARKVKIREEDKLSGNTGGMVAGGALGAVGGNAIGKGAGHTAAVVGLGLAGAGAGAGAGVGALVQNELGKSEGYEFIIKVDTSKMKDRYYEGKAAMRSVISTALTSGLITVVQKDNPGVMIGNKVYVIFSDNRTRVIPAN
jgi:outer membrane lipoprotein SlyB